MRIRRAAAAATLALACAGAVHAADANPAPLGSTGFFPSAEHPVGWRGDGSGQYPGANPPLEWGRRLRQLDDMRCAAAVPKDDDASGGVPASLGFFSEWLVAGPVPSEDPVKAIKEELLPGEASLAPRDGDKLGGATWKMVKVDDSSIDLFDALGPMTKEQAAYAQACLYVKKATTIWFHFNHDRGVVLWLNGKQAFKDPESPVGLGGMGPTLELQLQAGWNRFLFKLAPRFAKGGYTSQDWFSGCYVACRFWPAGEPRDYDEKNIAWIARMPGLSQAMPVIVGDRIFTTAHPYNLVCLDKKSGKIRWIRQTSPFDSASAAERAAQPDAFAKLDALAATRKAYYDDYLGGKQPSEQEVKAEAALEGDMDKLMLEVDPKYKRPDEQGEPDWWTIPTPVSDGKGVFVFLTRGVSACYDLDGNRRWIRYERPLHQHHGFFGSPVMAGGNFVLFDGTLTALDPADGSVRFSVDGKLVKGGVLWFASLNRAVFGGTEYIVCPGCAPNLVRASDGKVCGTLPWVGGDSTPACYEDKVFQSWQGTANVYQVKTAADGGVKMDNLGSLKWPEPCVARPGFYAGSYLEASPLIRDGLAYVVSCSGVLAVFDVSTREMVYRKVLPLDLLHGASSYAGASPAMAGDNIYVMGSTGVTVVFKPGREYHEVARNRVQFLAHSGRAMGSYGYFNYNPKFCPEYQDCTMTGTPIFDGNRMYFRGYENLYCIAAE